MEASGTGPLPRVVRSAQPWEDLSIPFGERNVQTRDPGRGGRSDRYDLRRVHVTWCVKRSLTQHSQKCETSRRNSWRGFFATTTSKPHDRPHEFGVTVCAVPSRIIFRKTSVSRINL